MFAADATVRPLALGGNAHDTRIGLVLRAVVAIHDALLRAIGNLRNIRQQGLLVGSHLPLLGPRRYVDGVVQ